MFYILKTITEGNNKNTQFIEVNSQNHAKTFVKRLMKEYEHEKYSTLGWFFYKSIGLIPVKKDNPMELVHGYINYLFNNKEISFYLYEK